MVLRKVVIAVAASVVSLGSAVLVPIGLQRAGAAPGCAVAPPPPVRFAAPVYIDQNRARW